VLNFVKESNNPAVINHNAQANQNVNGNMMDYSALQRNFSFY